LEIFEAECGTSLKFNVLADADHFTESTGRQDRLRLMQNVDTLSKSRKDAEEERNERLAEAELRRNNGRVNERWHDEENPPVDYLQVQEYDTALDSLSVEKYLTYNNPMITSFPVHTFIASALSAARSYDILPNCTRSKEIFADSALVTSMETSEDRRIYRLPMAVSEAMQKNWKERIRTDVVTARELLTRLQTTSDP
jgi:hypothetical protein